MIKTIDLKTKNGFYQIKIEENSIVKNLNKIISKNNKIIFLIDRKVYYIFQKIKNYNKQHSIVLNCSEKIKSLNNYAKISEKILKMGIDRNTTIVSIGGGTLGDLSGFIASSLLRGIDLILIPTTLLSQVDSSIGGKNGINSKSGKNLIGTFYQPKLVLIDPSILSTLTKREILSGYAEIVKHGIINNLKFFNWLDKNSKKILNLNSKFISKAIYESILIKRNYVLKDEKEKLKNKNSRAILNFGHTFGHAIETYYNYNNKITHGEAISIGMIIASTLSYKLKYLSLNDFNKIKNHFKFNKLPIIDKKMYDNKIFQIIKKDKKNTNNELTLILIKTIGSAFLSSKLKIKNIKKLIK